MVAADARHRETKETALETGLPLWERGIRRVVLRQASQLSRYLRVVLSGASITRSQRTERSNEEIHHCIMA
jgi:hypothetical protein